MTREHLLRTMERVPGVHDWRLRHTVLASTQHYLARQEPESQRTVRAERLELEVHNDHETAEGSVTGRGLASVTLLPGDDAQMAARIERAVSMAALVDNRPFELPGPADYPEVLTADRALLHDPNGVAQELAGQILEVVGSEPGISLASAEIFVDQEEVTLQNSRGAAGKKTDTLLAVDLFLLADSGAGDQAESRLEVRRRSLAGLDLRALVRREAGFARDALRAREPATGRFPVMVSGDALRQLLAGMFDAPPAYRAAARLYRPLAFRSAAQAKHEGLSPWELGQSIFEGAMASGDPLTVYANPLLPWGLDSTPFDEDGLPSTRLQIIERGVLRNFWAPQRYAEYLGVPATGGFGNLEVQPGSMRMADMWPDGGAACHVVAFSCMVPDPVTGSFVGEIRLGYERRGGEVIPVKGGSLAGNLFADLAGARFSQEVTMLGHYFGPEAVIFPALTISGN